MIIIDKIFMIVDINMYNFINKYVAGIALSCIIIIIIIILLLLYTN